MDNFNETIISSAPISDIKHFLQSITKQSTGQKYFCDDWEVVIERTWIEKMGSIHLHRTEITFFGKEETVTKYIKAFRMRFLSAGG